MDVAVGGRGLGGGAVACGVAVLIGGGGVGDVEGAGCVSVGAGVAAGGRGLGLAGTLVGEGKGDGVDVTGGCGEGVGCGVLVAKARTVRVLVGVGVTAEPPGRQHTRDSASRTSTAPAIRPLIRLLLLCRCCDGPSVTMCRLPAPVARLYSKGQEAAKLPGSSGRSRRLTIPMVVAPMNFFCAKQYREVGVAAPALATGCRAGTRNMLPPWGSQRAAKGWIPVPLIVFIGFSN